MYNPPHLMLNLLISFPSIIGKYLSSFFTLLNKIFAIPVFTPFLNIHTSEAIKFTF